METTKEKIVSLELSTPETEIPIEGGTEDGELSEKKPSSNTTGKKRRRKRTKSTDKQTV